MSDPLIGSRYQVVRRLATGGMGEVLLASSEGDSRIGLSQGLVVLKRTLLDHGDRQHQNEMLHEEARVSLRLRHENLVETFSLDNVGGDPVLVLEYLAGRSFAQILGNAKRNKKVLPVNFVLKVIHDSACGLHFAHTLREGDRILGLVHRDISPANIFITYKGIVKVIDFGVAKAADSEIQTSTGVLKGKLGYMAPEHAKGEKLDPRADLWSLGVLFWEGLTASRLFSNANPSLTLNQILRSEIPRIDTYRDDVPAEVQDLLSKLLKRDLDSRIQSAEELVYAIRKLSCFDRSANPIPELLQKRFPIDYEKGVVEVKKAAQTTGEFVPRGLVVMSDEDIELATEIADRRDLFKAHAEYDFLNEESSAAMSAPTIQMVNPLKPQPAMRKKERSKSAKKSANEAPTSSSHRSTGYSVSGEVSKKRKNRDIGIGWVACGVFAIVALILGLGLSFWSLQQNEKAVRLCSYVEMGETRVAACHDVVKVKEQVRKFSVEQFLVESSEGVDASKVALLKAATKEKLLNLLDDQGVIRRSKFPYRKQKVRSSILASSLVWLGVMLLMVSFLGLFLPKKLRAVAAGIVFVCCLPLFWFILESGFLSWPGFAEMEDFNPGIKISDINH